MKWKMIVAGLCLLVVSMAVACGTDDAGGGAVAPEVGNVAVDAGEDDAPITITFWTHANPAFIEAARLFADRYSSASPNVTVVHESFPDMWTQVYSAMAAGTGGDVIEFHGSTMRFAQGGLVTSVPESVMSIAEIESTFYAGALVNRYFNGRYYGLPAELNIESPGLFVNTALLQSHGFEVPQSWMDNDGPASWSEVMELARELTEWSGGTMMRSGLGIVGAEEISMLLSLIWQLGGDYLDPDNMRVNFNTPEGIRAAEFIMDLITGPDAVHSSIFSPRRDGFLEGTIAMTISAPWFSAVIRQDMPGLEFEYFNLPPFIEGSNPYFIAQGGWGYFVPTTTIHQEESWQFIRYMLTDENQLEWAIITGNLPSNMRVAEDEFFTTGEGRDVIGRAMQIAHYGRDPGAWTIDPSQLVWDIGRRTLEMITTGQISIEDGMALMDADANEMIQRLIAEGE